MLTFYATEKRETTITVPDGVRKIGTKSFSYAQEIERIVLPDTLTEIDSKAFKGCKMLREIKLPDNLEIIGRSAFEECSALTEIILPDSVKSVGEWAFDDCENLRSVRLSPGIRNINGWTFENCKNLKYVKIPEKTESIGEWAFFGCEKISGLVIPDSVKKIGQSAFAMCDSIKIEHCGVSLKIVSGENDVFSGKSFVYDFITEKSLKVREEILFKNRRSPTACPLALFLYFAYGSGEGKALLEKSTDETVKYLIDADDAENLRRLMGEDFFTCDDIDSLIDYATEKRRYEIQVMLLNRKNESSDFSDNPFDSLII